MHMIETMAYAGEVPWHGLGEQMQGDESLEQWQKRAGLDWTVSKRPVLFSSTDDDGELVLTPFKDRFVLARDSDERPFAVVSGRYKPVQPKQVLEFFRSLIEAQGYKIHTMGSLADGKRIWCLAETNGTHYVNGNDRVNGFLLISTSYDLTLSTLAQFTSVRVVCNNTLQQALADATGRVSIPHTKEFNADSVKDQLGIGQHQWDAFTKALDVIAKIKIDAVKATEVIGKVFQLEADPTKKDPNRVHAQNVIDMFTQQSYIGADLAGDTGWGALNCLTEYVDFKKGARNNSTRIDSAWFGDGARLKERGLDELLKLAA